MFSASELEVLERFGLVQALTLPEQEGVVQGKSTSARRGDCERDCRSAEILRGTATPARLPFVETLPFSTKCNFGVCLKLGFTPSIRVKEEVAVAACN